MSSPSTFPPHPALAITHLLSVFMDLLIWHVSNKRTHVICDSGCLITAHWVRGLSTPRVPFMIAGIPLCAYAFCLPVCQDVGVVPTLRLSQTALQGTFVYESSGDVYLGVELQDDMTALPVTLSSGQSVL